MKFLIDVGVGKVIEQFLIDNSYDVSIVAAINPMMTDKEILAIANNEQRIVITMDKDFGELVFNGKHSMYGVLLLRLEDANSEEKLKVVTQIFKNYSFSLPQNFCVYQNNKFRVKHSITS
jgi:predicted nuclease of predicted toxin-antitoxin system